MAKELTRQSPVYFVPVTLKNGKVEYTEVYTPLPPDTTHPLSRYLRENKDIFGYLHRYVNSSGRDCDPIEKKAHLGISTMMGLGTGEHNPFQSLTDEVFIMLHFLSDSQKAANKAAFLQHTFGVRHLEAGFVEYPLQESQRFGYQLFTKATEVYQKLQQAKTPQEGPTWFDMHVLSAFQSLTTNNLQPTPHRIHQLLPPNSSTLLAVASSLKKLEALDEITRKHQKRRTPVKTVAEVINDGSEVLIVRYRKEKKRRRQAAKPVSAKVVT